MLAENQDTNPLENHSEEKTNKVLNYLNYVEKICKETNQFESKLMQHRLFRLTKAMDSLTKPKKSPSNTGFEDADTMKKNPFQKNLKQALEPIAEFVPKKQAAKNVDLDKVLNFLEQEFKIGSGGSENGAPDGTKNEEEDYCTSEEASEEEINFSISSTNRKEQNNINVYDDFFSAKKTVQENLNNLNKKKRKSLADMANFQSKFLNQVEQDKKNFESPKANGKKMLAMSEMPKAFRKAGLKAVNTSGMDVSNFLDFKAVDEKDELVEIFEETYSNCSKEDKEFEKILSPLKEDSGSVKTSFNIASSIKYSVTGDKKDRGDLQSSGKQSNVGSFGSNVKLRSWIKIRPKCTSTTKELKKNLQGETKENKEGLDIPSFGKFSKEENLKKNEAEKDGDVIKKEKEEVKRGENENWKNALTNAGKILLVGIVIGFIIRVSLG